MAPSSHSRISTLPTPPRRSSKKARTRRRRQAAREAEPDAKSKAPTASLDAQPKTSEWPEFIGAKKLFGAVKEPAPLAARAIGTYARGCLSGAVALPIDGPAWQEMRLSRNRNWGHPKLIVLIEQSQGCAKT